MPETWVVNASPLIALARIGRLDLLVGADRDLLVPTAVVREVMAGGEADPARQALVAGFAAPQIEVAVDARVGEWGLGAGETAVLSLALERRARAVVDDRDARRAAGALGIPAVGTLGVVIRARGEGRIASAAAVIRELRGAGFRLHDATVRAALAQAFGEVWEP